MNQNIRAMNCSFQEKQIPNVIIYQGRREVRKREGKIEEGIEGGREGGEERVPQPQQKGNTVFLKDTKEKQRSLKLQYTYLTAFNDN